MDATHAHFVAATHRLSGLVPPASLRADWVAARTSLNEFISFWEAFEAYTRGLPQGDLTDSTYPRADWYARLTESDSTWHVSLDRLMDRNCYPG